MASQGHDTEAIAQYERARQYDPRARGVAHRLAILYDRTADLKRANAEFQLALKEEPRNPDLLNDVGYFCYNRGRWAEAEQYFRNAIAAKPDHAKAWNNLGLTLAQQERWQESLEAFGKVVSPSEAKSNLAFILTTRGKREEAKALYRQALADESDSKIARGALDRLENAGNKTTTEPKPLGYEVIPVPPRG
jgi:Tfp pilus assembly protein PilF